MSSVFELGSKLNTQAASALFDDVGSRRGQDVILDGGNVSFLGGQCFQILLAARRQWQADGHKIDISNPSIEMADAMARMGLPPEEFLKGLDA
ncbi:MAG: STAS domain-containing protein [Paracoccaceae bacterium]